MAKNPPPPISWDVPIVDDEKRATQFFIDWLNAQLGVNELVPPLEEQVATNTTGIGNLNARKINTTAPLSGGGNLSADRTIVFDGSAYVLLDGRAGGQSIIGGTGVADGLILQATSGAGGTLSYIRFLVGNNGAVEAIRVLDTGFVGVGIAAPTTKLDVDGPIRPKSYTVAGVPSASAHGAGAIIYVSNETGGAVLAFSDATNWRRCTDRAIVS